MGVAGSWSIVCQQPTAPGQREAQLKPRRKGQTLRLPSSTQRPCSPKARPDAEAASDCCQSAASSPGAGTSRPRGYKPQDAGWAFSPRLSGFQRLRRQHQQQAKKTQKQKGMSTVAIPTRRSRLFGQRNEMNCWWRRFARWLC